MPTYASNQPSFMGASFFAVEMQTLKDSAKIVDASLTMF